MSSFPEVFSALLAERGLSESEAYLFLNPDYSKLFDPLLLLDMEKARDRVLMAIKNNECIAIFSDYDADGIPGAVIFSDFFRLIGYENYLFYIPHRHDEGFGLNTEAIEELARKGVKLLITVDCGVADVDEVILANKLGLEVIITDHHEPRDTLPPALAVVNPKRLDSTYPFKELCGSAVGF